MKAFSVAAIVACVLVAGVASAQASTQQSQAKPPAAQTPAKPAAPAAAPAAPAQAPAPVKFPDGAKIAFINIQQIATESIEGKGSTAKLEALRQKKANELADKNKQIEALQAKQKSSVIGDDARAQAQRDIDRLNVDIQRMTQDAQQELQDMQNELQLDFQRKIAPIIEAVAVEKSIQLLFSQGDSGLVWADRGLDLTGEVIKRFDSATATKPAAAPVKK